VPWRAEPTPRSGVSTVSFVAVAKLGVDMRNLSNNEVTNEEMDMWAASKTVRVAKAE
jgi:hypothetical protein